MARFSLNCHIDDPKAFEQLVATIAAVRFMNPADVVKEIITLADNYIAKPLQQRINENGVVR